MKNNWLAGVAIRGQGRGRKLGFPTANLELDNSEQRPPEGIYAACVKIVAAQTSPRLWPASVHVGPVPTFNEKKPVIEVYLLGFTYRELYDEKLEVKFIQKIRDIEEFASEELLINTIKSDVAKTRTLLKNSCQTDLG